MSSTEQSQSLTSASTNYAVAPGEYLAEWMEENQFDFRDVARALHVEPNIIKSILSGQIIVTDQYASALADLTLIPKDAWLRYEQGFQEDLDRLSLTRHTF